MPELHVLRVFCDPAGRHGNPLGVVLDGAAVPEPERLAVAAALGFSETVFVDDAASGRVRIFTPAVELPLAGHPLVGTSWLLAQTAQTAHRAAPAGLRPPGEDAATAADADPAILRPPAVSVLRPAAVAVLRPPAGEVATAADAAGAWIEADPNAAPPFELRQYGSPAEIDALSVPRGPDVHRDAWAWDDEAAGTIRCRVFADGVGIAEDEATGSAALRLVAAIGRPVTIRQGRGSLIEGAPAAGGRVRVGGRVVADRTVDLAAACRDPAVRDGG